MRTPMLRFARSLSFVLAIAAPLGAQHPGNAASSAPRFVLPPSGATVELLAGQRPVVLATINGRGPFRLLVETGSPVSYLMPEAFARAYPTGTTTNDTLRVGDAVLPGVAMRSVPALGVPDIDGLLGLDMLSAATVTVDFPQRRLRLTADTLPAANGRDVLTLGKAGPFWTVPVVFADRTIDAILDTQSALSLSAAPPRAEGLAFTTAPVTVGRARGPTVGDVPLQRARLASSARIGDVELQQPLLEIMPLAAQLPQETMILGLQVLSQFAVTLDQRTGRVQLSRASRVVPAPPPVYVAGVTATPMPDQTRRVSAVLEGGAAQAAGIVLGDVIVALNGRSLTQVSDTEWRETVSKPAVVTFTVRRDGVEREVKVAPRGVGF